MGEISFFEDAALSTCLARVLADIGVQAGTSAGIGSMLSVEASAGLNDALVEICRRRLPGANVEIKSEPVYSGSPHSPLDMRIGSRPSRVGGKQKMLFIRVKDSAPKVAISLVALSLALWLQSPRAITDLASLAYAIYENIVALESPQDDYAISALDALLRYAAELAVEARDPASHLPTAMLKADELHLFGGPPGEAALKALLRLKELKLAEVVQFGGKGGDYGHEDNHWAHRV